MERRTPVAQAAFPIEPLRATEARKVTAARCSAICRGPMASPRSSGRQGQEIHAISRISESALPQSEGLEKRAGESGVAPHGGSHTTAEDTIRPVAIGLRQSHFRGTNEYSPRASF